jgi:hypothetical protein
VGNRSSNRLEDVRSTRTRGEVAGLQEDRDFYRELARNWIDRVGCPQCGQMYEKPACGPTHALIYTRVKGNSK